MGVSCGYIEGGEAKPAEAAGAPKCGEEATPITDEDDEEEKGLPDSMRRSSEALLLAAAAAGNCGCCGDRGDDRQPRVQTMSR